MSEKTRKCGWHHSERAKKIMRERALNRISAGNRTHGFSSDFPKLYNMWSTMKSRCENPHREKYKDYGARGISVCSEWRSAEKFCEWALKNGYKEGLQLDRIDNDGNYEPYNCRWVTPKENSRNRRNTVYLTVNGQTKCVSEWCESIKISRNTIYWWVREKGKSYAEKRLREYEFNNTTSMEQEGRT